jgi:hypothetical protein
MLIRFNLFRSHVLSAAFGYVEPRVGCISPLAVSGRGGSPLHPHVAYLVAAAGVGLTRAASGLTSLHRFFHLGLSGNGLLGSRVRLGASER